MNLPPGPDSPWFVQHYRWFQEPLQFLDECVDQFGDKFLIRLSVGKGQRPIIVISDPKDIQELLQCDPGFFRSGEGTSPLKPFLGANSMLILDGEKHQHHRKLIKPAYQGEPIRAYGRTMKELVQSTFAPLEKNRPLNVNDVMRRLSLSIILRTIFHKTDDHESKRFENNLNKAFKFIVSPTGYWLLCAKFLQRDLGPFSPWGAFLQTKKEIDKFIYREISAARKSSGAGRTDLLSLLVKAQDEEGAQLSDEEIRDEILTMILSGHETTATALAWAMYYIHRDQGVKEKLLSELDSIKEDDDQQLLKLPYLGAVCQETLRIRPSILVPLVRITKQKMTLLDYEFDRDTNFMPCIYLTHHRESIYPQPREFRPERFLDKQYSIYEYFPFGGSNRRCIGSGFAQFEMRVVIATIMRNWRLQPKTSQPVKTVRSGMSIVPCEDFRLIFQGARN